MSWFGDIAPIAPIVGAGIGAGASIIGGNRVAEAQEEGSAAAIAEQRRMFDQLRKDQAPYRRKGKRALNQLSRMFLQGDYSGFEESPGYQFRQEEGAKALDRSAAARGLLRSGPQMKALERYGQDYASNEFNTYANRLASLAGLGQTATQATGAAGMGAAGNIGQAQMSAGAARGSAYENTASSINQGLGNSLFYMMAQNQNQGGRY